MRFLALVLGAFALAACSTTPVARSESPPPSPALQSSTDSPTQFLLDAAATDFRTHPPGPAGFRDVRTGHLVRSDGVKQHMLCGEFLPAQEQGEAEWTPFATIKTDPYEQWLGAQAAGLCQQSSIVWDDGEDLSSMLQSRLESLQ